MDNTAHCNLQRNKRNKMKAKAKLVRLARRGKRAKAKASLLLLEVAKEIVLSAEERGEI